MRLHQLLSILTANRSKLEKEKTELYHLVQRPQAFQGLSKTYTPSDDDGFIYPSESKPLNQTVKDIIARLIEISSDFYDLAYQQDISNCTAKADIVVDEKTIAFQVPVSYLLFLEKQLTDLKTFIDKLPLRDISINWIDDNSRGFAVSEEKYTVKTKKITEFVVAYEATEHHPAQIKEVSNDIKEGIWTTTQLNGELSPQQHKLLKSKIQKLYNAVVLAREEANSIEVKKEKIADSLFNFLFCDILD